MNLGEIKQYCNFISNSDETGGDFKPDLFNMFIKVVNNEYYEQQYKNYFQAKIQGINDLINSSPLRVFIIKEKTDGVGLGLYPLPVDFRYVLALSVNFLAGGSNIYKPVEILESEQIDSRINDLLSPPIDEFPIGVILDDSIQVYPNATFHGKFIYLKNPAVPIYDYCISSDDEEIYMPPGYKIVYVKSNTVLLDENGNIVAYDVTHSTSPPGTYNSISVELEWDTKEHQNIANLLVEKASAKDNEFIKVQYADKKSKE